MNHYRITYSVKPNGDRVYPPAMKGVAFVMTLDHPTEPFMVAGTQATLVADGKAIVALTPQAAELLIRQLQDAWPKSPANDGLTPPGLLQ
jgi:hypothetical protein